METRIADCPLGAKCEEVKTVEGRPVLYRCPWYVQIHGTDVNTGAEASNWGCAIAWMPALMINTANEARKNVAATESFRNEMMNQNEQTHKAMLLAAVLEGKCE
jgi:hypothetical protein